MHNVGDFILSEPRTLDKPFIEKYTCFGLFVCGRLWLGPGEDFGSGLGILGPGTGETSGPGYLSRNVGSGLGLSGTAALYLMKKESIILLT